MKVIQVVAGTVLGVIAASGFTNYYDATASANYQQLLQDSTVGMTWHTLVSNDATAVQRLVFATPSQNSGSGIHFVANVSSGTFSVTPYQGTNNITAWYDTTTSEQCVSQLVSVSAMTNIKWLASGSVRNVRDYFEPTVPVVHCEFGYNITFGGTSGASNDALEVDRNFFDGAHHFNVFFSSGDTNNPITIATAGENDNPCSNSSGMPNGMQNYSISALTYPMTLNITARTNAETMPVLDYTTQLFDTSFAASPALADTAYGKQFAFLAYQSKFVAGSWRFLTYFGRDTLLTGYLMYDQLSQLAVESILAGAIVRIDMTGTAYSTCSTRDGDQACNSKGFICHEETLGDFAGYVTNNPSTTMTCDYKMVDTDLLLLPLLNKHSKAKGISGSFWTTVPADSQINPSANYKDLVNANVQHVIDLATPYANSGKFSDLVRIRHATVGNWRDSDSGLGGGKYPFDVNVALMPAALRAIVELGSKGVLDTSYSNAASPLADYWEANSLWIFVSTLDSTDMDSQIDDFSRAMGYSKAEQNTDVTDFPANRYALSLNDDGSAVWFAHSDLGAVLLFRNDSSVPDDVAKDFAQMASTSFPRGLFVNDVGLIVTNPAYGWGDSESQAYAAQLDNTQYHGTVVWEWQQIQAYLGMLKWNQNEDVDRDVRNKLAEAMDPVFGSMNNHIGTEVYSFQYNATDGTFDWADLNVVAGGGTESDLVQLWSYAGLGLTESGTDSGAAPLAAVSTAVVAGLCVMAMMLL